MSDYSAGKPVSARLAFSDEKVLKAETPMLIWHVHSWPGMAAHLTEPPLEGSAPTGTGVSTSSPTAQPERYVAVCDQQHSSDTPGVISDGTWFGGTFDNLRDACGVAAAHEDGFGHAALDLGSYLVAVACN
jgi:hypothetical protein